MNAAIRVTPFIAAMAAIVLASNILVQFPLAGSLGGVALGDILTWGAFTYPFSFLVTDLANRAYGPQVARTIVYGGFLLAIFAALAVPPILFRLGAIGFETEAGRLARIALASGAAFLAGQILDIGVFNRLRRASWWRAPALASLAGSLADTAIFFTLAFAPAAGLLGPTDPFSLEAAPLLGAFAPELPRWMSWAAGDLAVKLLIAAVALLPYRMLMDRFGVWRAVTA
jgi:hypothetical protein